MEKEIYTRNNDYSGLQSLAIRGLKVWDEIAEVLPQFQQSSQLMLCYDPSLGKFSNYPYGLLPYFESLESVIRGFKIFGFSIKDLDKTEKQKVYQSIKQALSYFPEEIRQLLLRSACLQDIDIPEEIIREASEDIAKIMALGRK